MASYQITKIPLFYDILRKSLKTGPYFWIYYGEKCLGLLGNACKIMPGTERAKQRVTMRHGPIPHKNLTALFCNIKVFFDVVSIISNNNPICQMVMLFQNVADNEIVKTSKNIVRSYRFYQVIIRDSISVFRKLTICQFFLKQIYNFTSQRSSNSRLNSLSTSLYLNLSIHFRNTKYFKNLKLLARKINTSTKQFYGSHHGT